MNPRDLEKILAEDPTIAGFAHYLKGIARPSVDLHLLGGPGDPDGSRLGGRPLVPRDFVWPTREPGEYRFLLQIRCDRIQSPPPALPTSGLLAFFYRHDELGRVFWQDPGYVVAYHWPDCTDLVLHERADHPAIAVDPIAGIDLPRCRELRDDWPDEELSDWLAYELPDLIPVPTAYLLGHPSYGTLAYDPTPGEGWCALLTLGSIEALDLCWHDGDNLMVFIQEERLRARDFRELRCDAG